MALAQGHSSEAIYGSVEETVIERQPQGFIPWLRRNVVFLKDPDPVTEIQTTKREGMAISDLELLAAYTQAVNVPLWMED